VHTVGWQWRKPVVEKLDMSKDMSKDQEQSHKVTKVAKVTK